MNHYAEESSSKYSRILDLYNRLLAGEVLNKNSLAIEYGVNPRSIQRDIDDIREFFSNRMISGSELTEIRYDRSAKGYKLVNLKTTTLTNAELFAVTKILIRPPLLTTRTSLTFLTALTVSAPVLMNEVKSCSPKNAVDAIRMAFTSSFSLTLAARFK